MQNFHIELHGILYHVFYASHCGYLLQDDVYFDNKEASDSEEA